MSQIISDNIPEEFKRIEPSNQTLGDLRAELSLGANYVLADPVDHINMKFFDSKRPIVINYTSNENSWTQCIGNIHAVVLHHETIQKSQLPKPVRNGRKPCMYAHELSRALSAFDDDMWVVHHYMYHDDVYEAHSFCSFDPLYLDGGPPSEYIYSDDGLSIVDIQKRKHSESEKIKLRLYTANPPYVMAEVYGTEFNKYLIFTNVDKEIADQCRLEIMQDELEYQKSRENNRN